MHDFMAFMAAPAVVCLILGVILTYFGVHVLKREIIFVDLSLAQLAALGTTIAYVMGIDMDSAEAQAISLGFILMGAAFFTFTRTIQTKVPQEAVIGIVYVVGSSLAILVVNHSPHGAEHIKDALNGSILWANWAEISKLLITTTIVSIVHWRYRHKFISISTDYRNSKIHDPKWDFLFYFTLGLVIVTSVKMAGIFLIFTFLIVPAVCGALFFGSLRNQFCLGSMIAVLVAVGGLETSFVLDLPTGAVLVCSFGVTFLIALIISRFLPAVGNN